MFFRTFKLFLSHSLAILNASKYTWATDYIDEIKVLTLKIKQSVTLAAKAFLFGNSRELHFGTCKPEQRHASYSNAIGMCRE